MADDVVESWYQLVDDDEFLPTSPLDKDIEAIKLEFSKFKPNHNLTLLMYASMTGNEKAVLALIKSGENINEKNMQGYSALTYAVLSGHLKCVQTLVANCADINCTYKHGDTILMLAAKHGFDDIAQCLINASSRKNKKSYKALYRAAFDGPIKCMETLVKTDINLNSTDTKGMTILMRAAAEGMYEVVECLAQTEAKVDLQCKEGRTALCYACSNGHLACVKTLVRSKADLNLADCDGQTPLMKAAMIGDIHIVYCLVKLLKEQDLGIKCKKGKTALFYAAEFGRLECVKVFKDTCIDETDNEGHTPLTKAILQKHHETVEYLLSRGAICNTMSKEGMSAIHYAAAAGSFLCLQNILLHDNRNIKNVANLQNRHGQTPLMIAAANRHDKIVNYLLADVNIKCYKLWTALHYASHGGEISCVRRIAKLITDINTQAQDGKTALMVACTQGMHIVVSLLLSLKVDINMQCLAGRTALHYAALRGNIKCAEKLLKAKALIDLKDFHGETPLILAARCGQNTMVTFLIKQKANVNFQNNRGKTALWYARVKRKLKVINRSYENANLTLVPQKENQKPIRGKYSKKLMEKLSYYRLIQNEHSRKYTRRLHFMFYDYVHNKENPSD